MNSETLMSPTVATCRRPAKANRLALAASVIIPTHNRPEFLKDTLASLARQSTDDPFEIIVVDNACSADLADYVASLSIGVPVRYVAQPAVGLHNARHAGARAADADILIYLDDDVLVSDGWLASMLAPYRDPRVGCVGGRTVLQFEHTPPDWLTSQLRAYLSEWDLGPRRRILSSGESPVGCNFSVRKKALFDVDGFNPDAFADTKLLYHRGDGECGLVDKIMAAGHKVIYQPDAWLFHRVPSARTTRRYFSRRLLAEGITSNYRCYRRHPVGSLRLLLSAAFHCSCWFYHRIRLLIRPNTLPVQLAAAFRWGRFSHSLRLLFSPALRAHVLQPSYLAKSQSIVVVFPPPYLDSSPGMRSLLEHLADEAYQVYVLTAASLGYTPPSFDSPRVHYLPVPPRSERSFFLRLFPLSVLLAVRARRLVRRLKPAWIIGALPTGLLAAALAGFASRTRRIYFSLELYPSAETKGLAQKVLKTFERFSNRSAEFTIIQDMYRGRQLIDDHKLDACTVLELPNSRAGHSSQAPSDYLQRLFNIPAHHRVMLYAGGIADWAESADLLQAAMAWPRDWHLVFHSPQARPDDPYIDALRRRADDSRIHFSLDPLAQEQMDELVLSAHVGLALYKTGYGLNNYLIGHSAGKISQYLRCRLPIVVSDLPSLQAWVDRFHCGLCVRTPPQTASALQRIFADYSRYQLSAERCFNELFKPDRYLDTIVARLRHSSHS